MPLHLGASEVPPEPPHQIAAIVPRSANAPHTPRPYATGHRPALVPRCSFLAHPTHAFSGYGSHRCCGEVGQRLKCPYFFTRQSSDGTIKWSWRRRHAQSVASVGSAESRDASHLINDVTDGHCRFPDERCRSRSRKEVSRPNTSLHDGNAPRTEMLRSVDDSLFEIRVFKEFHA